jgi:hypothetical protein
LSPPIFSLIVPKWWRADILCGCILIANK